MKILHVETGRNLYGGAQQVLYITTGLARRGVENVLVCTPGSAVAAAAREAGIDVVEIACGGDLDLGFAWRLRQVLADVRPDLVHCHSRRGADFLGGQAAAMLSIPAVVSRRVDNREPRWIASLRYRHFRRVVAISETVAAVLIDAGVAADKLCVIRSAVDVDRFAAAPDRARLCDAFGLEPDDQVIAAAAQFIARKGQRYLLQAVARLHGAHPTLRVVVFGQGPMRGELERASAELGLQGIVQFAGFRADLDTYLGAFDLLVHTALAEGLGVIALKAQAAGVPVVAFDAGGLREVVGHRQTGLLVPPADVDGLAAAIETLLDDRALRDRYAKAARERARTEFSIEPMVTEHLRLYESILHG